MPAASTSRSTARHRQAARGDHPQAQVEARRIVERLVALGTRPEVVGAAAQRVLGGEQQPGGLADRHLGEGALGEDGRGGGRTLRRGEFDEALLRAAGGADDGRRDPAAELGVHRDVRRRASVPPCRRFGPGERPLGGNDDVHVGAVVASGGPIPVVDQVSSTVALDIASRPAIISGRPSTHDFSPSR